MGYVYSKTLDTTFDDAVAKTRDALAAEGFGVVTEIDIQKTLKAKIGVDFRRYLILGACNPALAYEALKLEANVGAMLPCNVVVQEAGGGQIEVSAIDPVASMQAIANPELKEKAGLVGGKLRSAIERL
jgi:uncharacterized protein (DUF302 family)